MEAVGMILADYALVTDELDSNMPVGETTTLLGPPQLKVREFDLESLIALRNSLLEELDTNGTSKETGQIHTFFGALTAARRQHKTLVKQVQDLQDARKDYEGVVDAVRVALKKRSLDVLRADVCVDIVQRVQLLVNEQIATLGLEDLERDLHRLTGELAEAAPVLRAVQNELGPAEAGEEVANACPVCMMHSASHVFAPCGHVACQTCKNIIMSSRGQAQTCHTCRGQIQFTVKMYLS